MKYTDLNPLYKNARHDRAVKVAKRYIGVAAVNIEDLVKTQKR